MDIDAIFDNDLIFPEKIEEFISELPSAYLEKTSEPMVLYNRVTDFVLPNAIDMNDM